MRFDTIEVTGELIALVAVGGGLTLLTILAIGSVFASITQNRQREQTARELAAYVAEGTMEPGDAERLLIAARKPKRALAQWHKDRSWTPPSA